LAIPYLTTLWRMLGLLEEQAFVNSDASERAVYLMQFLAFGEEESDAPMSALDRLLCGLPLTPTSSGLFSTTATERQEIDALLTAMIVNWEGLGRTSIEGLRTTFLQRQGSLIRCEGGWQLSVAPLTVDLLLDQLPWSFTPCMFPWMPEALSVSWS
jgi:hypothetical protein